MSSAISSLPALSQLAAAHQALPLQNAVKNAAPDSDGDQDGSTAAKSAAVSAAGAGRLIDTHA